MSGQQPPKDIQDALSALLMNDENQPKQSYAFWGTQPVAQFNEAGNAIEVRTCLGNTKSAPCFFSYNFFKNNHHLMFRHPRPFFALL
jgi:hypothetical protein